MGLCGNLISHLIYHVLSLVFWVQEHLNLLFEVAKRTRDTTVGKICPPHVALAGDLEGRSQSIARLAVVAERHGARTFSVCCSDAASIEKACAQAGVRMRVCVRAPSPRGGIVRYARALACTEPSQRDCSVDDCASVVRSLEEWHVTHELEGEPDVLLVAPGKGRCMASFSVWQLRLTQFRFSDCDVDELSDDAFAQHITSAHGVAKRFGK